jgi:DNA-binding NarL/FixJ family response regulator
VTAPKLTVLLAEDHKTLREGLRLLLESDQSIVVCGEVEDGEEVVKQALAMRPNVVLMDVALVGLDGIEATRRLHDQAPDIPVLVLSARTELHVVRAALDAGAAGYVLKRVSGSELRDAVRSVAQGGTFLSPEVLAAVRAGTRTDPARAEDPGVLTRREAEILQLIALGNSNREISTVLGLSVKTVETHRMHVMEKLNIHDVAGLTRYAIRKGLVGW